MQQQSRHSPSKFYRKDEDQRKNSTADDIISIKNPLSHSKNRILLDTTQASNPKNKNTQQMREYSPNKEFEEELDISPRETVNSKKPTITPQKNPYLNSTQSVKMETKDSLFKSPFVTEEKPRNTESDIAIRLRSREDTFPNQLLNPQQSNKQQDLVDSLRFSNYDGDQDPFEIALDLFRKNLPANTNFIDCSCIGAILIEFFKELQIEVSDKTAWGIINEITDFIPRKVTEKSFMDLLILPQIKTLLSQFNIILNSNPPRLGRLSTHNLRAGGNQLISTDKKNSSLHSFSVISSSGISPREEKSRNSHHHLLQSRESTGNLSNKLMIDTGLANKFDKNPTLKDHNDSFASILNTSYQTSSHEPGSQKAGYFHSLTSSNTSCTNKTTSEEVEFLHSYTVMKWEDVYGKELSELFGQLLPYAVTPPKPIVDKEINSSLRKEIPTSSSEYMLLSRILDQFDYRLRKAVKGYNYSQHKRLEKVIEEKNLLRPIQYQYGPMEMKGKKLRHLEDPTLLALKQENSLQFYNWVLLFHAAKIDKLSELIENPNGFKEIYKHRPGNLIFSHNTELCVRRYKRY